MPNIFYTKDENGREIAKWPGVSKRVEVTLEDGTIVKVPRKVGQMYLGLVIDKSLHIFYKNEIGFFKFHTEDCSCEDILPEELPVVLKKRMKEKESLQ